METTLLQAQPKIEGLKRGVSNRQFLPFKARIDNNRLKFCCPFAKAFHRFSETLFHNFNFFPALYSSNLISGKVVRDSEPFLFF